MGPELTLACSAVDAAAQQAVQEAQPVAVAPPGLRWALPTGCYLLASNDSTKLSDRVDNIANNFLATHHTRQCKELCPGKMLLAGPMDPAYSKS